MFVGKIFCVRVKNILKAFGAMENPVKTLTSVLITNLASKLWWWQEMRSNVQNWLAIALMSQQAFFAPVLLDSKRPQSLSTSIGMRQCPFCVMT